MFDDVGWGDFGCYGGGVAVGAPTPNIDRLARQGLLLTSNYSEPSCTPSRASFMTGRLPMRHGLLRPPMYGEAGGLQGEVTIAELLSRAGYRTQAVGKWHMGENAESQPQNVGFDDFYGFLSVSDMYTEWRDPYFFPEIVYSEERTRWIENAPFNKCFVHATKGGEPDQRRGGHDPGALAPRRHVGRLLDRLPAPTRPPATSPGSCGTAPAAPTSTTTPPRSSSGSSPAKHPYKDTIVELDDIVGRLVRTLEETGQLEDTLIYVSSDNGPEMETWPDAAYSPFRSAKGSTWEGGQRVPGIISWPGMIDADRSSDGLFSQMDFFPTLLHLAGADDLVPDDRYIDGVDQTSFLLDPDGLSNRKYLFYWLGQTFSALRVGEWKFMLASTSDDDRDVLNLGGFSGVTQKYTYGKLFNLYLDPKETRSYLIRKLAYLDAFQRGIMEHLMSFRDYPAKRVVGGVG